jgi:hypothetical protein
MTKSTFVFFGLTNAQTIIAITRRAIPIQNTIAVTTVNKTIDATVEHANAFAAIVVTQSTRTNRYANVTAAIVVTLGATAANRHANAITAVYIARSAIAYRQAGTIATVDETIAALPQRHTQITATVMETIGTAFGQTNTGAVIVITGQANAE